MAVEGEARERADRSRAVARAGRRDGRVRSRSRNRKNSSSTRSSGSCWRAATRCVRRIGEGGMGAVYEAKHALIGKRVAVKVLLEKFHAKSDFVARLLQEARLASSIGHENIVDVTDFGTTDDGRSFVVMEFLDGESLADLERREAPLPIERSLRIARQAASALGAAHAKGIFHRDVKPENLYLVRRGDADFVKVVDFGISKAVKPGGDDGAEAYRLTHTGLLLGTPLYMSPEQARGDEDLDHRADIWALGVLLYECLTGRGPVSRQQLPADHLAGADPRAAVAVAAAPRAGDPRRRRRGGDARDGEGSHAPLPDDGGAGGGPGTAAGRRSERRPAPAGRGSRPGGARGRAQALAAGARGAWACWPSASPAALRRPGVAIAPGPPPAPLSAAPSPRTAPAESPAGAPARPVAAPAPPSHKVRPRPERHPARSSVGGAVQRGDERIGETRRAPPGVAKRAIRTSDPSGARLSTWWWRALLAGAGRSARADDATVEARATLRDRDPAVRCARARAGADRVHQGQRDQTASGGACS